MVWTCAEEGQWNMMLKMELTGRRQRGRPKRRFIDAVRDVGHVLCCHCQLAARTYGNKVTGGSRNPWICWWTPVVKVNQKKSQQKS